MRIRWKIVDQILKLTNSTPSQLLAWMSDPIVMQHAYPCDEDLEYLGNTTIYRAYFDTGISIDSYTDEDGVWDKKAGMFVPDPDNATIYDLRVPLIAKGVHIYDFWHYWRADSNFRNKITAQFKRRYDL